MVPGTVRVRGEYVGVPDGHPRCSECAWHVRRGSDRFCFANPPSVVIDVERMRPMSARPNVYEEDPACGGFERFEDAWQG